MVECRENVRFFFGVLERSFLSSWLLDSYTSISSISAIEVDPIPTLMLFLYRSQGGNP